MLVIGSPRYTTFPGPMKAQAQKLSKKSTHPSLLDCFITVSLRVDACGALLTLLDTMGIHADSLTFAKLTGIGMSGAGLGIMWKFARHSQLGGAMFSLGFATAVCAECLEIEQRAKLFKQRIEEGQPPHF